MRNEVVVPPSSERAGSTLVRRSDWPDDLAEDPQTYRRLAVRVIERALKDIAAPGCAATDLATAREFLAGSSMLVHWCNVATLDPRRVMALAHEIEETRVKSG